MLSELRLDIPVYYSTPEMRLEAKNDEEKFIISKKAIEYFTNNYDCITVDGVKLNSVMDGVWYVLQIHNQL